MADAKCQMTDFKIPNAQLTVLSIHEANPRYFVNSSAAFNHSRITRASRYSPGDEKIAFRYGGHVFAPQLLDP